MTSNSSIFAFIKSSVIIGLPFTCRSSYKTLPSKSAAIILPCFCLPINSGEINVNFSYSIYFFIFTIIFLFFRFLSRNPNKITVEINLNLFSASYCKMSTLLFRIKFIRNVNNNCFNFYNRIPLIL